MSRIPQLRGDLVRAAGQRYQPAPQPRRSGRVWRAVPLTAVVLASGGVGAAVAVAAIGTGSQPGRPSWNDRVAASRQALINELAALRRPQTAAERAFARTLNRHEAAFYYAKGSVDRSLVRLATTTAWGERIYLVPITPWTPQQARAHAANPARVDVQPAEQVIVYTTRGPGFAIGSGTPASIRKGHAEGETYGPIKHGTSKTNRLFALVPDGVTTVTWLMPRQPGGSEYGFPTYARVGKLTTTVHGNIAATESRRATSVETWYTADGRIIRRSGSIAAARRVVPVNGPGPETAQSRAAERDPSTPNPITVTPAILRPNTVYLVVHFHVLLNNAAYIFRVTSTRCPGYHVVTGYSQPGDPRGNLRGDTLNVSIDPSTTHTLCTGTYHVSVRVAGIAPVGSQISERRVNAKPFGSATFTVR
jgi:hypothetical protein